MCVHSVTQTMPTFEEAAILLLDIYKMQQICFLFFFVICCFCHIWTIRMNDNAVYTVVCCLFIIHTDPFEGQNKFVNGTPNPPSHTLPPIILFSKEAGKREDSYW